MKLDSGTLHELVEERLPRGQVRAIQSAHKDPDRFDAYLELLQERVPWDDPIVLPFGEHLFVVAKPGGAYGVKCDCGHEFGPYSRNWKEFALVRQRDDPRDGAVFVGPRGADPEWMILREFYCPGCATQVELEYLPPGHPLTHDIALDIDALKSGAGPEESA